MDHGSLRTRDRGWTTEQPKRTFWGDANVLYQLFGEVYKTIYICKCICTKSLNCTLKVSEIYCIHLYLHLKK